MACCSRRDALVWSLVGRRTHKTLTAAVRRFGQHGGSYCLLRLLNVYCYCVCKKQTMFAGYRTEKYYRQNDYRCQRQKANIFFQIFCKSFICKGFAQSLVSDFHFATQKCVIELTRVNRLFYRTLNTIADFTSEKIGSDSQKMCSVFVLFLFCFCSGVIIMRVMKFGGLYYGACQKVR